MLGSLQRRIPRWVSCLLCLPNCFYSSLAINTSLEVYESTADVVQLAWIVAANPKDMKSKTQLQGKCDEWSEKLDIVRATVDKLVNPWSVMTSLVLQAVTLKDQKLFAKQVGGYFINS